MKQIWAQNLRDEKNISLVFTHNCVAACDTVLNVACNVPHRITLNGKLVGYGPRRMAHGKAAVSVYPLAEFADMPVKIEIEAVSYRVTNFYIINQTPFFAAEIVTGGAVTANSLDFKAYRNGSRIQKVQRYSYTRGFTEAYELDGAPQLYAVKTDELTVCELSKCCAPYPVFDTLDAELCESGEIFDLGDYTEYDDSYINRRNTPHFERSRQQYRVSAVCDAIGFKRTDSGGDTLRRSYATFAVERNAAGFISFTATVDEDADLIIQFDEILSGDGKLNIYRTDCINAVNYKLKKGIYSLATFEPYCLRYIRFIALGGCVRVSGVKLITYERGVKAELDCGDPDLNLMFEAAVNSFKPNAVDILTDCPSRERAGWLCDSFFTARAEKVLTGNNDAERNLIEAYRDCPPSVLNIPPQVFAMCYPADHITPDRYIPNWCMWFILELRSYIHRGGDRALVYELKDRVCAYLDYTLRYLNDDGLLENPQGWIFVEWSKANDFCDGVNYPTNMLFTAALRAASELYGKEEYASIAERAERQIKLGSYDGLFFADNAVRVGGKLVRQPDYTEACQYYAFTFGFASAESTPELYDIMFGKISGYDELGEYPFLHRSNSFIGLYLRLDYLCRIGEYGKLISDMKKYFLFQAEQTKTFWEYKDAHGSCCHGFASVMCEWILKAVGRI